MSDVTQLLDAVEQGETQAAEELLPLVYTELRRLARQKLAQLPPGQTLQATALVHEAVLRLLGSELKRYRNSRHFFNAAAEAMRHILIDQVRRKRSSRHGGGHERVNIELAEILLPQGDDRYTLLAVNEALDELERIAPDKAQVVKLKFFAGLTEAEIASVLGVTTRTVERHWSYARAWLFAQIAQED